MILGILEGISRPLFTVRDACVAVKAFASEGALLAEFETGMVDWIVWPRGARLDLVGQCGAACVARPVSAGCELVPDGVGCRVVAAGRCVRAVVGDAAAIELSSPVEARGIWHLAWGHQLLGAREERLFDDDPRVQVWKAALEGVAAGAMEDAVDIPGRSLRRRLERVGLRPPRRFVEVARVLLGWERARLGAESLEAIALSLGYEALWGFDRMLMGLIGVTASKLAGVGEGELGDRLGERLRRGVAKQE
jgi:hypothetical protein